MPERLWTTSFIRITLINLLLFFGFNILTPTLPLHIADLGAADATIGWITGLFTISALLVRPLAGVWLDRVGRKIILAMGLVIFALVGASYTWLASVPLILGFRFIHGFGWGAASTASNTIASDVIPASRLGEGMGFFTLSSNVAMALAPAVGLSLIARYGFSSAALTATLIVGLSLLLGLSIPNDARKNVQSTARRASLFEPTALRPASVMFFATTSYGAINSFLALYARELGIANVGLFFTLMAGAMVISRPGFGRLIDRYSMNVAMFPGMLLCIAAMLVLAAARDIDWFYAAAVLYGIGFGAAQTSLQTLAVKLAPRQRLGSANSTFYLGFDSGIGLGSIILGALAAQVGYRLMFVGAASLVFIGLVWYSFSRHLLASAGEA